MKSLGWVVDLGVFIKKLPLIPIYFAKWQRPEKIDKRVVDKLVNKYRKILINIEPGGREGQVEIKLNRWGFKKNKKPMLPSKTILIDLKKSRKQLLKEMHSKTRYNLKRYKDGGLRIKILAGNKITEKQLKSFYDIYKNNLKKKKFWGLKYWQLNTLIKKFGKKAYMLLTEEGGLLVLMQEKTAYYSHNASSSEGRKKFVPTLLTWEAIKLSKELGLATFDFEGIQDERYLITKKWSGFSRFKKSFGGRECLFQGSFSQFFFQL